MAHYIINSTLCSGLLLAIYQLFLSSESLYRFNRFYLLFSLAFSLVVPFVAIQTTYKLPAIEEAAPFEENVAVIEQPVDISEKRVETTIAAAPQQDPQRNYLPQILIAGYGVIALAFLVRFLRNAIRIKQMVVASNNIDYAGSQLVVLDDDVTPHSFLNYIFISKNDYQNGIAPQIICHEHAHVAQRHSVDVIIVELLQIVCWFNPLIPFYRKAIQLNHEFLADEAVLKSYQDTPEYQLLLLSSASKNAALSITSQFNYLTTKKRLIMMTKNTTAKIALYKKIIVLPALAIALFLFSEKISATPAPVTENTKTLINKKPVTDTLPGKVADAMKKWASIYKSNAKHSTVDAPAQVIDTYHAILKRNGVTAIGKGFTPISNADTAQLRQLFEQMSEAQQNEQFLRFSGPAKPMDMGHRKVSTQQLKDWQADAKKFGVWIDDKRVKNASLAKYTPNDFYNYFYSRLERNAREHDGFSFQANLYTDAWYANYVKETQERNKKPRMMQVKLTGDKVRTYGEGFTYSIGPVNFPPAKKVTKPTK
jgi:bla regulator protein BlaR1